MFQLQRRQCAAFIAAQTDETDQRANVGTARAQQGAFGRRIKIRYMTQKSARPPTFLLFANIAAIPDHYLRYLMGSLRERFQLPGVPIRIQIRTSKNPYKSKFH